MLRHLRNWRWNKPQTGIRRINRRLLIENLQSRQVLATIIVDSLIDGTLAQLAGDGHISLREALQAANTNRSVDGSVAGQSTLQDTIRFAAGLSGTITLASGAFGVTESVLIQGPGTDKLTLDGGSKTRVFFVSTSQNSTFRDFAIVNGKEAIDAGVGIGGGILNSGSLTLERVSISNCIVGSSGGGIYNSGTMSVVDSTIANNLADGEGGGIGNEGRLTIRNSTLVGNSALEGQTSGAQAKVRVSTTLRGVPNNRFVDAKTSTVYYAGTDFVDVVVPPAAGEVSFPSTTLGIDLQLAADFEGFGPGTDVDVDVTITDVDTDDSGTITIIDTVIGSAFPKDGLVQYDLNVTRQPDPNPPDPNPVIISGRQYSIQANDFQLRGIKSPQTSDSVQSTATLVVGPNSRKSTGGAIYNFGVLGISSSTIVGNKATSSGGGIYSSQEFGASETIDHTILAGNVKADGIASDFESNLSKKATSTFSIIGAAGDSGIVNGQNGNIVGADWKAIVENDGVRPLLQSNGGPTKTVGLLENSIAIDRGSTSYNSSSIPNDQRGIGFPRIVDGNQNGIAIVDIGAVEFTPPKYDFGDAPTSVQSGLAKSYPVLLSQNGARHKISPNFVLGALVDDELDGIPSASSGANSIGGDDGTGSDDEDGIESNATILSGSGANVSSVSVTASNPGKLDAWIDFNRDGDWDDAGEKIANSLAVLNGVNLVSFGVPSGLQSGNAYARFRLSSQGELLPTGVAADGEVEDVMLQLSSSASPTDMLFQLPISSTVEIGSGSSQISLTTNGSVVFRSNTTDANTFRLQGSTGDDTFLVGDIATSNLAKLSLAGNSGADRLQFTATGFNLDLTPRADAIVDVEKIDIRGTGANSLKLNLANVQRLSGASELRIQHDADDTVSFDPGWKVFEPKIVSGSFLHVLKQGTSSVAIQNDRPFHNPYSPLDVDFSGDISPLDVLTVINFINSSGTGPLANPTSNTILSDFKYIDTIGDNSVGPLDVLVIINFLNERGNGEGEAHFLSPLVFALQATDTQIAEDGILLLSDDRFRKRGIYQKDANSNPLGVRMGIVSISDTNSSNRISQSATKHAIASPYDVVLSNYLPLKLNEVTSELELDFPGYR